MNTNIETRNMADIADELKAAHLATLNTITRAVLHINNSRLDGHISRVDHAKCMTQIQDEMNLWGITWFQIETNMAKIAL